MLLTQETLEEYLTDSEDDVLMTWALLVLKTEPDKIYTDPDVHTHKELLDEWEEITALDVVYAFRLKRLESEVLTMEDGGDSLDVGYVIQNDVALAVEHNITNWLNEINSNIALNRVLKV